MEQVIPIVMGIVGITVGSLFVTLYVIGHVSRWYQLATLYPEKTSFTGKWHQGVSMVVNGVSFNGCVDIGQDDEYLFVKPGLLVNTMYKPIQIPWSAVKSIEPKKVLWAEMTSISLKEPAMTLLVRAGLLDVKSVPVDQR